MGGIDEITVIDHTGRIDLDALAKMTGRGTRITKRAEDEGASDVGRGSERSGLHRSTSCSASHGSSHGRYVTRFCGALFPVFSWL